MCAIAAPALAASIAASAIAAGVIGTRSDLPVVSPAPVTAQVMKTSQFTARLSASPAVRGNAIRPPDAASSVAVSTTSPLRLDGRSALVTGCGSEAGIGFACAQLLAELGARVTITSTTDRIEARAAELRAAGADGARARRRPHRPRAGARAGRRRRGARTARSTCSSTTPGLAQTGVEIDGRALRRAARARRSGTTSSSTC